MSRKLLLIFILIIFVGILGVTSKVSIVRASEIIYIKTDGSIVPSTAPIYTADNITYTLTDNIYDSSLTIEKSWIVVNGSEYTIQGTGLFGSSGIYMTHVDGVTIRNMRIRGFEYGIYLTWSRFIHITANEITENNDGIACPLPTHEMNFSRNKITNNRYGIYLSDCSNSSISGNNITNNSKFGIYMFDCVVMSIFQNNITKNADGINAYSPISEWNENALSISENQITANSRYGIALLHGSNSYMVRNSIVDNGNCGIFSYSSSNNIIRGNTIANTTATNSSTGVWLEDSGANTIIHNNFIGNRLDAYAWRSYSNSWDEGEASGGNYWSNQSVVDANKDGIIETPKIIDADNVDNYPAAARFTTLDAYGYEISIISNSSITNLNFTLAAPYGVLTVTANLTGTNGTQGFFRIYMPNGSYTIMFDGEDITYQAKELPSADETYECLYINYTHSDHTIEITGTTTIIPEFPYALIPTMFFVATLMTVIVYRRKHSF